MNEVTAGSALEFVEAEREGALRAKRRLMTLVEGQTKFWELTEKLLVKLGEKDAANACRMIAREGTELLAEIREARGA